MNQTEKPLYVCIAKASTNETDGPRHSFNWIVSKRSKLKVFSDRLEFGDWIIRYSEIDEAILFRTKVNFFIPCFVLQVTAADAVYQFGLNSNPFWSSELPFKVCRTKMRSRLSVFSFAVRLVIIAGIIYLVWQRFKA